MNATPVFIHGFAQFIFERSKAVQGLDQATRLES
jgi:hypothetical protein